MTEINLEADLPEHTVEYASRQDVEAAITALTPADRKKLMVASMYWCKRFRLRGSDFEPEDLLQEAVLRALKEEKGRRWPKKVVTFVKYLDRSMESIAGHHVVKLKAESEAKKATKPASATPSKEGISAGALDHVDEIESKVAAQEELETLQDFFGSDTQGFRAVCCQAEGMSTAEIFADLGIDSKEWETVRKRVRRKLAKYVKENEEEQ